MPGQMVLRYGTGDQPIAPPPHIQGADVFTKMNSHVVTVRGISVLRCDVQDLDFCSKRLELIGDMNEDWGDAAEIEYARRVGTEFCAAQLKIQGDASVS